MPTNLLYLRSRLEIHPLPRRHCLNRRALKIGIEDKKLVDLRQRQPQMELHCALRHYFPQGLEHLPQRLDQQ